MQWALTIVGQEAKEATYMELPDGAAPPIIGDSFHVVGELAGYYTVVDRQFMTEIKTPLGACSFGWAFTLKVKPLNDQHNEGSHS